MRAISLVTLLTIAFSARAQHATGNDGVDQSQAERDVHVAELTSALDAHFAAFRSQHAELYERVRAACRARTKLDAPTYAALRAVLKSLPNTPADRLPLGLQGFVAFTLTAFGEARGLHGGDLRTRDLPLVRANMGAVMMVIYNRQREVAGGAPTPSVMDIALQRQQFSAWNRGDPNLACMVLGPADNPAERLSYARAVSAYVDLAVTAGSDFAVIGEVGTAHYVTRAIHAQTARSNPRHWMITEQRKILPQAVVTLAPPPTPPARIDLHDGRKGHLFYKGVAWSYRD